MGEPHLLFDVAGGIARLTLNRPDKRNALSPEMIVRPAEAWDHLASDPSVRVALLTGAGDVAFCSGADLGRLIPLLTGARPRTRGTSGSGPSPACSTGRCCAPPPSRCRWSRSRSTTRPAGRRSTRLRSCTPPTEASGRYR